MWLFLVRLSMGHPVYLAIAVLASVGVALSGIVSMGLILPFLASLGGTASMIPPDFPLAFFMPYFESMGAVEKVRTIAFLLLGIQVIRGLLSYTESRVTAYMKVLVEQDLRQLVFDELMAVELRWIQRERMADLFNIMHTYPSKAATLVDQYLAGLTKAIAGVSYFVLLLALSWQLTLVAGGLALVSLLLVRRLNESVKGLTRRINESRVRLHQTSMETLHGMRLIRSFGREQQARARFLGDVKTMRKQSFRRSSITSIMPQLHAVLNMVLFTALIFAATLVLDLGDSFWILQLTVFILVMSRLIQPMVSLTRKQAKISEDLPAVEEVMRFLARAKPKLPEGKGVFHGLRDGIRIESVSYAYDAGRPVLQDATIAIERGEKVALVGPSGSGKSTLLHLLNRLADPTSGRILIDGVDLRALDSRTWRGRVAVVTQETFLFNDTVRNNILFGSPGASHADIERAARLANAHEFIIALEHGYDTSVGDRGALLSGGQAQRIAIARAILADPDVLVLDEATSALDAGTERLVQEAIDHASRDRTVVAVAHRLATVMDADRIYVLQAGRVVQVGTHAELLAQPGPYGELVRLQDLSGTIPPAIEDAPRYRVLLRRGGLPAILRNGGAPALEAPVVVERGREEAERRADAGGSPLVVLYPGADVAFLRIDGQPTREAPLFQEERGVERRVRVKGVLT